MWLARFLTSFYAFTVLLLLGQPALSQNLNEAPPTDGASARQESVALDGNASVPITIKGHYLKVAPGNGSSTSIHKVEAAGIALELDTSLYPNLQGYLDKGYLVSGKTGILVKGLLSNAPAKGDTKAHLVCKVREFQLDPPIQPMDPNAASSITDEDRSLAEQMNAAHGLTVLFIFRTGDNPTKFDRNVEKAADLLESEGLKIVNKVVQGGMIRVALKGKTVTPALIHKLRATDGNPQVKPWDPTSPGDTISIPPGEGPFSVFVVPPSQ